MNARKVDNLYVIAENNADECLKKANILLPKYGNAFFYTQDSPTKAFKELQINEGTNTGAIEITINSEVTDGRDAMKGMQIQASSAQSLRITTVGSAEIEGSNIYCPDHSPSSNPKWQFDAPCVIDLGTSGYFGSALTIFYVPDGFPKGIEFPSGIPSGARYAMIDCGSRVDDYSSYAYLSNLSSTSNCYKTNAPTMPPTVQTQEPSNIPTIEPTNAPTKIPSDQINEPSNITTMEPATAPITEPPSNPTSNADPFVRPTIAPTVMPNSISTHQPSSSPVFITISPSNEPTSLEPSNIPTSKPITPLISTADPSVFPTTAPTVMPTGISSQTQTLETHQPTSSPVFDNMPPSSEPTRAHTDTSNSPTVFRQDNEVDEPSTSLVDGIKEMSVSNTNSTDDITIIIGVVVAGMGLICCIIGFLIYRKGMNDKIQSETSLQGEVSRMPSESLDVDKEGHNEESAIVTSGINLNLTPMKYETNRGNFGEAQEAEEEDSGDELYEIHETNDFTPRAHHDSDAMNEDCTYTDNGCTTKQTPTACVE